MGFVQVSPLGPTDDLRTSSDSQVLRSCQRCVENPVNDTLLTILYLWMFSTAERSWGIRTCIFTYIPLVLTTMLFLATSWEALPVSAEVSLVWISHRYVTLHTYFAVKSAYNLLVPLDVWDPHGNIYNQRVFDQVSHFYRMIIGRLSSVL